MIGTGEGAGTFWIISNTCFVLGVLFAILAIVMFFRFRILHIWHWMQYEKGKRPAVRPTKKRSESGVLAQKSMKAKERFPEEDEEETGLLGTGLLDSTDKREPQKQVRNDRENEDDLGDGEETGLLRNVDIEPRGEDPGTSLLNEGDINTRRKDDASPEVKDEIDEGGTSPHAPYRIVKKIILSEYREE